MPTESSVKPIKILIVEDFHVETGMIQRELNDADFNFDSTVASNETEYTKALHDYNPDVILSPYSLSSTNAVKLLSIARAEGFEIPFILLAFDLSEDIAIDLLAEGVEDYVQRSTLKRLPVAIKKALQRFKAKDALEKLAESLALAQSIAKIGSWVLDPETNVVEWSEEMFVIHELEKQRVKVDLIRGLTHPDDIPLFDAKFTQLVGGDEIEMVYRNILPVSKQVKYFRAIGKVLKGADGSIKRIFGTVQEIDKLHRVALELKRSQASLMEAQKIAKIGSWEWSVGGNTVQWSDEMYNIYERDKGEVTLQDVKQYIHPEDQKRVGLLTKNDLDENINRTIEYRILLPSGKVKHVISVAEQVKNEQGVVTKLVGTLQDVSDQVRREEQIRTLSLVASETINGVLIHDPSGLVTWANKGFTQITGYPFEEIVGNEPWAIMSDENTDTKLVEKTYESLSKGEPFSSENQLRHKGGHNVWVSTTFTPVKDESGKVVKVVSIGTDITKQKEIELLQREALSQLEKDHQALKKRAKG